MNPMMHEPGIPSDHHGHHEQPPHGGDGGALSRASDAKDAMHLDPIPVVGSPERSPLETDSVMTNVQEDVAAVPPCTTTPPQTAVSMAASIAAATAAATTRAAATVSSAASKPLAERDARRRRKRRLYHLLNRPDAPPSFMAVVQAVPKPLQQYNDDEDDDDDDDIPPPFVVIDVDAYLGFKVKHPDLVSSLSVPTGTGEHAQPDRQLSATTTAAASSILTSTTPAEEGFYEGSRVMAMPEDAKYLSDMHVWLRHHLEYFSATADDVTQSQAGRRTKAVRGQVGIRCIHCARYVLPRLAKGEKVSWPPGAVSYPVKFEGVYATASQKPQLHFETCPSLPPDSQLATMLQEARATQRGSAPLTSIGKRKRMVQGVSGLMYYVISCQRIGLQEISGGNGLRFTRDLSLEALDLEPVRTQVEQERPDLIPRQYQSKPFIPPAAQIPRLTGPDTPLSTSGPLIESHPSTQAVLRKALEEADDPEHHLIRRRDKTLLTDYMFLAISQMALCWASPQDFVARGKKTKMMRLGLAGFCCRHCQHDPSAYSCRSYSSAPDNLASAISNSFILHLQKCPRTPREIQLALSNAKRVHTRQMGQMPYGSQRKIFFELWDRMRAADRPPPEGHDHEEASESPSDDWNSSKITSDVDEEEWDPEQDGVPDDLEDGDGDHNSKPLSRPAIVPAAPSTTIDFNRPNVRGVDFPISTDPEALAVVKAAEDHWDPTENDNLILPEDRQLVSDYVFLTMRQLRVAIPRPSDFRGNRRSNVISRMPGLCCIHCAGDPSFSTPSGRSFPSAPDNMASALNSSFYNHMQHCPRLNPATRRALLTLRKIHSQQCSSMIFGSQRRFFTKVYDKLKIIPMTTDQLTSFSSTAVFEDRPDSDIFRENGFVECGTVAIPFWQCMKCRMVPFEFRAVGGVHYVRPTTQHLQQHRKVCKDDGIHLGWTQIAFSALCSKYKSEQLHKAMKPLIELVVGNDADLASLFLGCVTGGSGDDVLMDEKNTTGWWRRLPHTVDLSQLQSVFESSAKLLELSSSKLIDHPAILRALEIISPCLQYQESGHEGVSVMTSEAEIASSYTHRERDGAATVVEVDLKTTENDKAETADFMLVAPVTMTDQAERAQFAPDKEPALKRS